MEVFGLGIRIQEEGSATVEAAIKRLRAELVTTASIANSLGAKISNLTNRTNSLSTSFRTAGTTSAQSAGLMESSLRKVGTQFAASYLGVQAFANGLRMLVNTSDTMLLLGGRINLVATSTDNLRMLQDRLFDSSQLTRTSLAATSELFARISRNSDQLGMSQAQLLNVTELTQMSIRTSGINAIEASRGMIQFSQALASGVLRGDEFRAVSEQMPGLARSIADGLGVPVSALKEMANAGELTAEKVIAAIQKMEGKIRADFSKLPVTIGDGMTRISNSFANGIRNFNDATGAAEALGKALSSLANRMDYLFGLIVNNIENIKAVAITLGGVLLAVFSSKLVLAINVFIARLMAAGIAHIGAATAAGIHSTAMIAVMSAASLAAGAVRGLYLALGGPLGIAIIAAVAGFALLNKHLNETEDAFNNVGKAAHKGMNDVLAYLDFTGFVPKKPGELTEEQIKAIRKQIAETIRYNELLPVSQRNVNDLVRVEKALDAELKSGNITLERRIEVFQQLRDSRQLLYEMGVEAQRSSKTIEMFGRALSGITITHLQGFNGISGLQSFLLDVQKALQELQAPQAKPLFIGFSLEASRARMQQDFRSYGDAVLLEADRLKVSISEVLAKDFGTAIADGLENGIAAGLQAAIMSGKISSLWKAMAQTFVGEIANMMVRVAMTYIKMAAFIQKIQAFLINNPAAAIAAAAAMLAFGYANGGQSAMGGTTVAGGAGGLSTGISATALPTQQIIFGATSATTAAGMTPRQSMNVTVIGPNDPSAQRAIQELMTKANSRGRIG